MDIEIQFTPTSDDYIESMRVFGVPPWELILIIATFTGFGIYCFITALDPTNLITNQYWYSPFALQLGPPMLYWAIVYFIPMLRRMEIRGQYKANEALRNPVTWSFHDDQIITKTKVSEMKLDWSVYSRTVEFGPQYLFFHRGNEKSISFIPKRSFLTPEQQNEFRNLVEQKVGKMRAEDYSRKILPDRIKLGGMILLLAAAFGYWVAIYWKLATLNGHW